LGWRGTAGELLQPITLAACRCADCGVVLGKFYGPVREFESFGIFRFFVEGEGESENYDGIGLAGEGVD
jgi:hypothetical protein